ncbi:uncharacterized protein LOC117102265 isoform X1 [Anneissia japonica]|uniref:uncharacterized protein LOC117102265 isoform X1 n=2 Tax=Anneissia japonica TaxID=1529436 RepID=UPI0014258E0B|nr:uncharacterized protein LOC117102265 isoform X1 [Anneissia japonica]
MNCCCIELLELNKMVPKRHRRKIQIPRSKYDSINESVVAVSQVITESTTMSDSFVEREKKEREKLRLSNSIQLQQDLHSIFEREEHYDLTFVYKKIRWNVHTALLQQRAPIFYSHVKDCGDEVTLAFLAEEECDTFSNWLRALYTEDSVDNYEATVNEWISKFKKSIEDGTQQMNEHENVNLEELNHQQEMVVDSTGKNVNSLSAEKGFTDLPECCSQLGNDLISTLISGKGTDLELRVHDGMVRVHKFIVSGRTHYFAAMLSGAWRESSDSYIYLPNFSLSALLSTLYFIYGGVLNIPQTASICELLFIADMYNLQGLKEVVMLRLKSDNCHFFHKPCAGCLACAPEALALSVKFHETNFTKACLRWMTKHFVKVWRSKSFAAMGKQLMQMCYENALEELKPDSVVAIVTQSDKLLETLPRVKWNEPLIELVEKLRDAGLVYIAENFTIVSRHENFQLLLQGMGWSCNLLELMFNKVVAALVAETANSVFLSANYLKKMAEEDELSNSVSTELVKFYFKCYTYMVSNANHQILIDDWNTIPEDIKCKIKQDAVYVDEGKKTLVPKPKLTSASRPKPKPLQVEKPAPTSVSSARPAGARPKIKTAQAKPTELTSKSSVKAKTSEKAASSAQTPTMSNRSQSMKPQSTKPKESSTKLREASAKSKDVSNKSRENSAKSISASVKSTHSSANSKQASTKLSETSVKSKEASTKSTEVAAKSKEAVAKPNEPSTKSREPVKPEKLSRQPKSAGVLKNKQPVRGNKVDRAVRTSSTSASPLRKPPIDKKGAIKPSPIKQMPSVKSSSISTKGSSTSRVQKTTRPPHCKPSSSEKPLFGKSKSKDVTDTKFKMITRKQADPAKSTLISETQLKLMVKSKTVTSTTHKVSTAAESLDMEGSIASVTEKKHDEGTNDNAKNGNANELDIPESYITESSNSIFQMSSNSADNGNVKVIKEIESMPSLPDVDNVTVRTSDNSIVEDADKLVLSNTFICDTLDEGFSNTATEEEGDDNKNIDNNLQISSQSTEEQSHSSSQLPSETALKCDDMCDQKSNNTEASDIEMDDFVEEEFILSDGRQFDEEDEGTCSEELQKVVHDKSNNKESLKDSVKICESSEDSLVDLDINADMISDAREDIVNEYPEEISAVKCDENINDVDEYQDKDNDLPEQVLDETEDVSDVSDVDHVRQNSKVVKNQEIDDAFAEQVTSQIEVDVNDVGVDGETVALSLSTNVPSTDKSIEIERSHVLVENDIVKETDDISLFHKQDDVEDHVSSHEELIDDSKENAETEHTSSDIESTLSVSDCDRNIGNENIPHEQVSGTDDIIPLEIDKEANEEEMSEEIQYGEQNEESDETKEENCLQLESDEVNDDAEADENMQSDDNLSGSTKPVTNGVHNIDSAKGESHAEEEDEEAAEYSERFILSKALRHGTTNGASSVTVSQQVE